MIQTHPDASQVQNSRRRLKRDTIFVECSSKESGWSDSQPVSFFFFQTKTTNLTLIGFESLTDARVGLG